jgi:preprotein translocase subunit SecE
MGKVQDQVPARSGGGEKPRPVAPEKGGGGGGGGLGAFVANLFRADRFKPNQGRLARLWTAIGLGVLVATGLYALHNYSLQDAGQVTQFVTPLALGAVAAWAIWRVVEYPPFAEFLIATEAEMNKVSWSTWDDLKRATLVVLTTVLVLSLFLLGVDVVWSNLLKALHVLQFDGGGGFGSQAG